MAKESRRQIVEQTRNEVARQYKTKVLDLEERNKRTYELYSEANKKRLELQRENEELKEKVSQYEDWIDRLQSYMDMPADEREKALANEHTKYETNQKLSAMIGTYSRIFNLF